MEKNIIEALTEYKYLYDTLPTSLLFSNIVFWKPKDHMFELPYYYPIKTVISDEGGIKIEAIPQLKLIEAPIWLNLNLNTSILEGIPPAISGEATYKVVLEAEYDGSKATKTFYIFLR